ncbi:uncharacterized protein V6R79_009341 [Siganus canaliculatus]
MSSDRPYKSDVMGWSPQQLANYLKKMNLSGCDKVVLKNSISGSRFVNLSDNDLQKFPKLHVPMVSKISTEISKRKEERRPFLPIKTAKYLEPVDTSADVQGWDDEEFDDDFDNDYESPYSGDEEGSGGDYESPNEDGDGINDYEPPPSEPPEDLPHKLCPTLPIGDSDYIDNRENHVSSRGPPPVCPRPPVSTLSAPPPRMPAEPLSSRRDHSPHPAGRLAGNIPPGPPQIFRNNKPGKNSGSHQSPIRGPQPTPSLERGASPHWSKSQHDVPDPPAWSKPAGLPPPSIGRSNSSARPPPDLRYDSRREQKNHADVPKHNTFPLHNKSLHPRPGLPGPPSRPGDSLPLNISSAGSLPPKLPPSMAEPRGFAGSDRQSFRPPSAARTQELDPSWYVGKVTRGQAEGCLKRVRKDGAYLVRDSTRQQANQPYTLMVLYQEKVYNVQIRQQNQQFLLGTGLKVQEMFPSVRDILGHYSQSPLLLIDAKNRGSGQQNQCLLSAPAGYSLTGQNWS